MQYECATATKCNNLGGYFAALSTEACDAQGGTWCPVATDCSDLKTCIETDIADSDSSPAYKSWLEGAPTIDDTTDASQCGTTRQFFGYDEMFINDAAICAEIRELRHTRNFEHLNSFFGDDSAGAYNGAGSTASDYAAGFTPITVDELDVEPVEPPDIPGFLLAEINEGTFSCLVVVDLTVAQSSPSFCVSNALRRFHFLQCTKGGRVEVLKPCGPPTQ